MQQTDPIVDENRAAEEPIGYLLPFLSLLNEKVQKAPKKEPKISIELPQP